jgi:hypothetical protein
LGESHQRNPFFRSGPLIVEPTIQRLDVPSPYVVGAISTPRGFLLHASRSGAAHDNAREFAALCNVARSNEQGLGWHASIGPGVVAVHMSPTMWGWNAREHSRDYIAAEFSQGQLWGEIEDSQIDAYCWWVQNEVLPVWPNIPRVFVHHAQLAAGIRDGKTDVYPNTQPLAQRDFVQRIKNRLGW